MILQNNRGPSNDRREHETNCGYNSYPRVDSWGLYTSWSLHSDLNPRYFSVEVPSYTALQETNIGHSDSDASRDLIDIAPPEMDQSVHICMDGLSAMCCLALSGTAVVYSRFRFHRVNATLRIKIGRIYSTSKSDLKTSPNDDGRPCIVGVWFVSPILEWQWFIHAPHGRSDDIVGYCHPSSP